MMKLILKQLLASVKQATAGMMFIWTDIASKAVIMTEELEALEQAVSDSA
jgi:hypothetical protein